MFYLFLFFIICFVNLCVCVVLCLYVLLISMVCFVYLKWLCKPIGLGHNISLLCLIYDCTVTKINLFCIVYYLSFLFHDSRNPSKLQHYIMVCMYYIYISLSLSLSSLSPSSLSLFSLSSLSSSPSLVSHPHRGMFYSVMYTTPSPFPVLEDLLVPQYITYFVKA